MLLDEIFFEKALNNFEKTILEIFTDKMVLINKNYDFSKRGFFILRYKYLPLDYFITIENELRRFTITIEDIEGAKNTLYRIEKFDNTLTDENMKRATKILKRILDENKFVKYLYKNEKLYEKSGNELRRVKDLKKLMNK